uniref:Structural maintenance of chromosomes protein 4 n=1 Tax=Cacopsylla melanoneura TaxID=428564 RepID=A0A8D8SJ49_9HEMI
MTSKKAVAPTEDVLEELCPSDDEGGCYIGDVYIPPPPPIIKKFKTKGHPRLIIHSIEITNFKSYAGTQTLGPFCKSFNAIIGPNGSGKSNVIDAMLFVFGSRASRIRCTNNQSLVHNSETVRNCDSCTVTVKFVEIIDKTAGDYEIVPNSDIHITRTAYKYNNISYYYITERQVAFKEIAKLLKKHGVDLINNRFLILQGEVEQISQMPCKGKTPRETGLLEYLEEIIGTDRYNVPLTQLRQRIGHHEEEREQRLERMNAVKTNVETLQTEVEQCLTYFGKENQVRTMEHQIAQVNRARVQEIASESAKKKEAMEKLCEERRHRITEAEVEVSVKQEEVTQVETKLNDVNRTVIQLEDSIRANKNKITSYETLNKEIQKKLTKYATELSSEQSKEKTARDIPSTNQGLIEKLEKEMIGYETTVKEKEKELEATVATIADATKELKEEKDRLQKEQIELRRKFNEAKSEFDLASSELSVYTSTEDEQRQKMNNLKTSLIQTTSRLEQFKVHLADIEASLPGNEALLKTKSQELLRLSERELQGGIDLRKYQDQSSEIKDKMQTHSSRNQLIDFVMKLKRDDVVSGILGRLGDLGAIDEQYDQAVSTACGHLDHIVCETVEAAQALFVEVKRANVGRVYCYALSEMEQYKRYMDRPRSTPGNLPRMFDLVRVEDERIRPAMFCAMQNLLVAPSLQVAMKVGYENRVRVVSLQGDVIEPSGVMSGGGRTRIAGKMGRSVKIATDPESTVQNLKKINRKMDNLEKELANIRSQKGTLERTVSDLKTQVTEQKRDQQRLRIDIPSLESHIQLSTDQIATLKIDMKNLVSDPKQVKKMTDDVKKKRTAMDKCEEQAKKLEEKVARVHENIMGISAGKTSTIEKSLHEAQRKLNKAKSQLNNLRVEIKRSERDVITSAQRAQTIQEELKTLGTTRHDNKEHIEIYEGYIEQSEAERKTKNAELKKLKSSLDALVKEMSKLKASLDKEEEGLERASRELRTVKHKYDEQMNEVKQVEQRMKQIRLNPLAKVYDLEQVFAKAATFEEEPDLMEELPSLSADEIRTLDVSSLESQIVKLETELKFMDFNESRVGEYKQKIRDYAKRSKEMQAVLTTLNTYSTGYEQCLSKRQKEFDTNFDKIRKRVQECYQMLTFGGKADLEYKEYSDPYAQGIKYVVRPPRKSWKSIDCLSGGEKTLASLALVFALHYYSPSPLYFMDEIDAALDTSNVAIIGHFIRTRTKFAQFIIISLRDEMFSLATNLIGIYQHLHCTRSVTITKDICKDNYEEDFSIDIDDSDDEDEDENDTSGDDTSQQDVEMEQSIPAPLTVGPGTGAPLSGEEETEPDTDNDTEADEDNEDADNDGTEKRGQQKEKRRKGEIGDSQEDNSDEEQRGVLGTKRRRQQEESQDEEETRRKGRKRRGRRRTEEEAGGDSDEIVERRKRREVEKDGRDDRVVSESDEEEGERGSWRNRGQGRSRREESEREQPISRQRLRVRGVKQINAGADDSPRQSSLTLLRSPGTLQQQGAASSLKKFIEQHRSGSSTPKRVRELRETLRDEWTSSSETLAGKEKQPALSSQDEELGSQDEEEEEVEKKTGKKKRGRPAKVRRDLVEEEMSQDEDLEGDESQDEERRSVEKKKKRGRTAKARRDVAEEEMSQDELLNKPEPMDVPNAVFQTKPLNGSTQSILQRGINQMTLDMERAIRAQSRFDNVLFAPLSIVGALALVLLGADGETKRELVNFMGVKTGRNLDNKSDVIHKALGAFFESLQPAKDKPRPAEVRFANGIFYESRYKIKKQYEQLAAEFYRAENYPLDFGNPASAHFVNKWVANRTEGRIENLLPGPLSPQIVLILANVIYFKGQWEVPFQTKYNKWDVFHGVNSMGMKEMIDVEMMTQMARVEYSHSQEGQVLGLPYKGDAVYMYFILPKNPDLKEYTKDLSHDKFLGIIAETSVVDVIYTIPKIKLTNSIELRPILNSMNVTSMFDISKSDLSNMLVDSDNSSVAVDQVFHKVDIELSEEGTEAAASTGIIITRITKPMVKVNRPFIFFIYHRPANTILFWGSIYKVDSNSKKPPSAE